MVSVDYYCMLSHIHSYSLDMCTSRNTQPRPPLPRRKRLQRPLKPRRPKLVSIESRQLIAMIELHYYITHTCIFNSNFIAKAAEAKKAAAEKKKADAAAAKKSAPAPVEKKEAPAPAPAPKPSPHLNQHQLPHQSLNQL